MGFYLRHPMIRTGDTITIEGANGDKCRVAGPMLAMEDDYWGPELAQHSTGLFDTPFKTNWGKGMFGQRYSSWSPQRRDVVATFHIMSPVTGSPLDNDPDVWHSIHSRFMNLFGRTPETLTNIRYDSVNGTRRLTVRLLQEAKSFANADFEGMDPHLLTYGTIMLTLSAEIPYYIADTATFVHEGQGDGSFTLPYFNPGTVPIWPQWVLTAPGKWTLPDYSFGSQEYGRGGADIGKTVTLPKLNSGENVHVDSRPDTETIISENAAPVGNRWAGKDLEYCIPPGGGVDTVAGGATVRIEESGGNYRCELDLPRWYAEPFSDPLELTGWGEAPTSGTLTWSYYGSWSGTGTGGGGLPAGAPASAYGKPGSKAGETAVWGGWYGSAEASVPSSSALGLPGSSATGTTQAPTVWYGTPEASVPGQGAAGTPGG